MKHADTNTNAQICQSVGYIVSVQSWGKEL